MFYKKAVLWNFAKFTEQHLALALQLYLKRDCEIQHAKLLRTPILQNSSERLLLIYPVFQNNYFRNLCECS